MLFNSFVFLLVFLPLVLAAFYASRKWVSARASLAVLVVASFIFYGYWNPVYLLLLVGSILTNYEIGRHLNGNNPPRILLILGIALNLSLLGYFKYTNFLIDNANSFFGLSIEITAIILPLAISFFTFQQIAYLVDCYKQTVQERDFLSYCLFVSFFPQLIAGPIVHHKEIMPQFARMASHPKLRPNFGAGLTLLIIGLFKKVVIADNFAVYASRFYDSAGESSFYIGDAWVAALSYHFQIYFDFSGYSDMAIGLGLLFGIVLPINFNSPYKSLSIVDFWRRWHMTLSRFLRDYLYIVLGGNRKGSRRRYLNLFVTMLLGGLWHGAAWTFIVWGGLHGSYLVFNHGWQVLCGKLNITKLMENRLYRVFCLLLTTLAVIVAWVYFRAPDMTVANQTLMAMFGAGEKGFSGAYGSYISTTGFSAFVNLVADSRLSPASMMPPFFIAAFIFTVCLPNAAQLFNLIDAGGGIQWRPTFGWAAASGFMLCCSLVGMFGVSEFIYFQF